MGRIRIIPIPPVDTSLLPGLARHLSEALPYETGIDSATPLNPAPAFDFSRNQHNSTALIAALLQRPINPGEKILGITGVDLFVPVLTFVFGEAQLDGPIAVLSTHRLNELLYGMPANEPLLAERLLKEAIHELGHCYGLVHCHTDDCVMRSSTSVEEIDIKSSHFCAECKGKIFTPGG